MIHKAIITIIAIFSLVSCKKTDPRLEKTKTLAAWGVIHRTVPAIENKVIFEIVPSVTNEDYFELTVKEGILNVKANNNISLCRGVYDYLKNDLKCIITWDGDQIEIPEKLSDTKTRKVTSPVKFRHYMNFCTAGYTMAFWDWKRWEREIDWMALHGINMPLALNGQEKVWQTVWSDLGVDEENLKAFFPGPAYLPWFRMGNLNAWQGPLPQAYIDRDAALQKKILAREYDLGMTPIMPAFSGFVPNQIKDLYPTANISKSSGWLGFEPTNLLEPRDTLFTEISKKFAIEYEKEYGKRSGYYIADLYTEMTPQVNPLTAEEELHKISKNVYHALKEADTDAVWILQGWMFHYEITEFWNEKRVNAFLDGVPQDKLIVLDLSAELDEVWKKYDAVGNRQFIWNLLHNFGQHTNLFGYNDKIATLPAQSLKEAGKDHMVGMGLTMEGIEQNDVQYELMLDMMWRDTPLDLDNWIKNYAQARYHSTEENVSHVWQKINKKFYQKKATDSATYHYASYQKRPSENSVKSLARIKPDPEKKAIIKSMLDLSEEIQSNPLYKRDLVDVSKEYFQEYMATQIVAINTAIEANEKPKAEALITKFNVYLENLDALLATEDSYNISRWIEMAKSTVSSPEDKALLEKNARMQITVWGGDPILNDYARKEWSGLVSDYYKGRWNLYFNEKMKGNFSEEAFDKTLSTWEYGWSEKKDLKAPLKVTPIEQVKKIMEHIDMELNN